MSLNLNEVRVAGRCGQDPEVEYLSSGDCKARLSIAVDESYTRKTTGERVDKTTWLNVVFFGKVAQIIEKHVKKGTALYVEGKIQVRSYEDKNGEKKYVTEIKGDCFQFVEPKNQQL